MFRRRGRVDDDRVLLVHDASRGARVGRRTPRRRTRMKFSSAPPSTSTRSTPSRASPRSPRTPISSPPTHHHHHRRRRRTTPSLRAQVLRPAHGYDPKSKRQSKRKTGAFHPLHHVPGRGFVIQWPSSKKTSRMRASGAALPPPHTYIYNIHQSCAHTRIYTYINP